MLTITEDAKAKIRAALETQDPPADALRVSASGGGRYAMNLEPDGKPAVDDVVLPYEGFRIFVDPTSVSRVEGATLAWVDTATGGGFQFTNPNDVAAGPRGRAKKEPPAGPEGAIWRQIQEILDAKINPAVASHGGHVSLIDVQEGTVFVELGGGCQGCGMANVTLKHGIESVLKDEIPEIEEILDVTDHAGGRNPYYAPSSK
jgi:Fe/S biogenesis protein NfuA